MTHEGRDCHAAAVLLRRPSPTPRAYRHGKSPLDLRLVEGFCTIRCGVGALALHKWRVRRAFRSTITQAPFAAECAKGVASPAAVTVSSSPTRTGRKRSPKQRAKALNVQGVLS